MDESRSEEYQELFALCKALHPQIDDWAIEGFVQLYLEGKLEEEDDGSAVVTVESDGKDATAESNDE